MLIGTDGKPLGREIEGKEGRYINASELQLKHIALMFDGFIDFIKTDELFKDGVPDMHFGVSPHIRVG